ncbi:unnamed protein product [Blepharisma stoltei]|uniref:Hexose transporter 1 n=1 Tax=Blepharisma stoltei TaxID=1481888 RepID=A0AAU9IVK4_9CILI|nr:unnamed protein product [Blepharisma stoltei]
MRLGIMLHFFQQWCGINAIQFYSTGIFSSFGKGEFFARILTLAIKLISMIGVVFALLFVDRLGRKPLLYFGNIGMAVCLLLMGLFSEIIDGGVVPPIIFIALFLIFYEASAGPITWVYCGEILDAKPMSACVSSNWTFNIMVVFLFPSLSSLLGISTVFFIYSGVCFLAAIYFKKDLTETKGKSKISIQEMMKNA